MRLELQSAPWTTSPLGNEPLTLAEAKAYLRITDTDDDTEITDLIKEAREWAERATGRALITQTWLLVLDAFPEYTQQNKCRDIFLPKGKTQSVTSFTYVNSSGVTTELVASPITGYQIDMISDSGGILRPPQSATWQSTRSDQGAVRITFTAGYGTASTDLPSGIRTALKFYIADQFETRGRQDELKPNQFTADRLLEPYVLEGSRF